MHVTNLQFRQRFPQIAESISAEDCGVLLQYLQPHQYRMGTTLIRFSTPGDTMYFVLSGLLSVAVPADTRNIPLGLIGPGQWVGEVSALDPGETSASVMVVEDVVLLSLSHAALMELRHSHARIASTLMHLLSIEMADRLRATTIPLLQHVTQSYKNTEPTSDSATKKSISTSQTLQLSKRLLGIRSEILKRELTRMVNDKQNELENKFAKLREQEKDQVLTQERERIMRDMHDGIGGQLVSTLAMIETGDIDDAQLAHAIRTSLDDLRLMIDSLDPVEGELSTVLAMLRSRLEPRLKAHDIQLRWRITDIPPINDLGPHKTLQILRILQETVTNIIKHADARYITVATGLDDQGDNVYVSIHDDGKGFIETNKLGSRGLQNMRMRAQQINATLQINSTPDGTSVKLSLPLHSDKLPV